MPDRRHRNSLAVAAAALLFFSPAFAQTAPTPTRPGVRPPPIVQPQPPQPQPPKVAPIRPSRAQAGTVIRPADPNRDDDGDGTSVAEGDCDDANPQRYPGNTEVANTVDEDCNDYTIGVLDGDRDGFTSYLVSNGSVQGDDCDDSQAGIRPDAQELPNRLDDNCDGAVDNLLGTWWTPAQR